MQVLYFVCVLLVLLIVYFALRKKKATTGSIPSDSDYQNILEQDVAFYRGLSQPEKSQFEKRVADFLDDVRIEGVGNEITEQDRVLVAASAIIPVFRFNWRYKNLSNVILYPDAFDHEFNFEEGGERNIGGMVGTGFMNGQMVLSKPALLNGFLHPQGKNNTGIHEFVHLLDKTDGATDGIPENLLGHQYIMPWVTMMHKEMQAIKRGDSDIDTYALTNEAEFLAVVSEYFFEQPEKFKERHPEMHTLLSHVFHQDKEG